MISRLPPNCSIYFPSPHLMSASTSRSLFEIFLLEKINSLFYFNDEIISSKGGFCGSVACWWNHESNKWLVYLLASVYIYTLVNRDTRNARPTKESHIRESSPSFWDLGTWKGGEIPSPHFSRHFSPPLHHYCVVCIFILLFDYCSFWGLSGHHCLWMAHLIGASALKLLLSLLLWLITLTSSCQAQGFLLIFHPTLSAFYLINYSSSYSFRLTAHISVHSFFPEKWLLFLTILFFRSI